MIANLVLSEHPTWIGDARIYRLTPPYQGHEYVAVIVQGVEFSQWQNAGVEVVGCNEVGEIPGDAVTAVHQDYVVKSHADVLADLGYSVQDVTP